MYQGPEVYQTEEKHMVTLWAWEIDFFWSSFGLKRLLWQSHPKLLLSNHGANLILAMVKTVTGQYGRRKSLWNE